MDEVRVVQTDRGVGVLVDCEVVEVVDQSGEDCGIIGGEVEGGRVCFLYDEGISDYRLSGLQCGIR